MPSTPEALRELFAPGIVERHRRRRRSTPRLRQVLEGPKYATLFDLDRKLLELQQLAMRRDKDVAAFQAIVQKAWNTAFERFSKRVQRPRAKPRRPGATWPTGGSASSTTP